MMNNTLLGLPSWKVLAFDKNDDNDKGTSEDFPIGSKQDREKSGFEKGLADQGS